MTARKKRINIDKTIENIQPPPPSSPLNEIARKQRHRHYDDSVHKCRHCPQQFFMKFNLLDHEYQHLLKQDEAKIGSINFFPMKVPPASIKTFSCPQCHSTFLSQQLVTKHIRTQHTNEKPFECPQCDMTFDTKNHLDQHQYVHSIRGVWPCNLCKMQFNNENHYINHKRIHAWILSVEPHFPFDVDDQMTVFANPSGSDGSSGGGVNGHHANHTNGHHAAAAAANSVPKKNSMQMIDIISISSESQSQAVSPVLPNNAKKRKTDRLGCHECNKTFANSTTLQRHQLIHSGVNFKCKQCEKTFHRQAQLKNHEKTHKKKSNGKH